MATLRSKLLVHISGINVFIASLSAGSLARIEGILDDLVRDIKEGKKEPSIISTHQTTDEAAWNELERESIGDGITKQDIETYKEDIKEYLKELIQGGLAGIRSESVDLLANSLDDLQLWNSSPRLSFVDTDENGWQNGRNGFNSPRVESATYASDLDGSLNEAELPQQDSWHSEHIEAEHLQYKGWFPIPFSTSKRKPLRPRPDGGWPPLEDVDNSKDEVHNLFKSRQLEYVDPAATHLYQEHIVQRSVRDLNGVSIGKVYLVLNKRSPKA